MSTNLGKYAGCTCGCDACNGPILSTDDAHCGGPNCCAGKDRCEKCPRERKDVKATKPRRICDPVDDYPDLPDVGNANGWDS